MSDRRDAWRLALGTLTAFPVQAPTRVDPAIAGRAARLAPLAAAPLGAVVALVLWVGDGLGLASLAVGFLAVGVLVLATRAFHVDGLADTADGLTASYDRERSLDVMKTGDVGPAGVAAVVVVLGLQAVGFAQLDDQPLYAAALVCLSRSALAVCCLRGIPGARQDGLGTPFASSVSLRAAAFVLLTSFAAALWLAGAFGHDRLSTLIAFGVALLVIGTLIRRAVRRLGGVTGDIFGAAIELTLATLLVTV